MIDATLFKNFYKNIICRLPGYHFLCLILQKNRPKTWDWIDRIPVKPGILVLVHSSVGDFYMSRPERCSIAKKYFWTQGFREPLEDRMALDLFAILSKHSDVALDIGANSGLFSLVAHKANPSAEVVAFDILPEAYHILIDNSILNGFLGKIDIKLVGVGEGGIFYAPFNNISSDMPSSLSLDCAPTTGAQVAVSIKSLDEICIPRYIGKKICIKIDVEGTEIDIFSHACETLKMIKPNFICEVLPGARQFEIYDKILSDYSYRKYMITDIGLKQFDRIRPDIRFKDWFFTAEDNLNLGEVIWQNSI